MVTIVEGKEDLHEVVPDGIFWDKSIMSLSLLDDGGEVTTATEFHEDVEDARIAIDVSVMIAYDVLVVEVLEDITGRQVVCLVVGVGDEKTLTLLRRSVCGRALSCARS